MLKWSSLASSLILVTVALVGCEGNKSTPPAATTTATAATLPSATATAAPATSGTAEAAPSGTAAAQLPEREIAGAAHVLVSYKGAEMAPKGVTRSKDDAKKRAAEALDKIKKGMPFEEAAKKYSDDEGSKNIGGAIGNFEKNAMPEAFSKATFGMKVGEISDVVETPRGFHVIKRTR